MQLNNYASKSDNSLFNVYSYNDLLQLILAFDIYFYFLKFYQISTSLASAHYCVYQVLKHILISYGVTVVISDLNQNK